MNQRFAQVSVLVVLALLGSYGLAQPIDEVSPSEFIDEEVSEESLTVTEDGALASASLTTDDLVQCLGYVGEVTLDTLVVYGFAMLDGREYRLNGNQAVVRTLSRARLNAQTQAARFFEPVRQFATTIAADSSVTTQEGVIEERSVGEVLERNLSTSTRSQLVEVQGEAVTALLRGGRVEGTKVIALDTEDLCVGVRYSIPLDQEGYEPGDRDARGDESHSTPERSGRTGEEPVEPGSSTKGKF